MDLEQRVQALEQELQILKTQIQVTLLDIQEQLLSNTYPGLRSGDAPKQENVPSVRAVPEPEESVRSAAIPVRKVSFNTPSEEPMPTAASAPAMRPSNQNHSQNHENHSSNHENRSQNHENHGSNNNQNWQAMAELEAWAGDKIEALGPQQTAELIEMYAAKGRFNEETRDLLLEFVGLYSRNQKEMVTRPSRPTPFEEAPRSPQGGRAQTTAGRKVLPSQPQAVKAPPVAQPVKATLAAQPAKVVPAQKPAKTAAKQPAQSATPKAAKPAGKQTASKVTILAKPQPTTGPRKDSSRNVVLKLIAGVQNAGAGVRWGKHNG